MRNRLPSSLGAALVALVLLGAGCGSAPESIVGDNPTADGGRDARDVREPEAGEAGGETTAQDSTTTTAESTTTPDAAVAPDPTTTVDEPSSPDPGPSLANETAAGPEPTLELDSPDGAFPLVWVRRGARVEVRSEANGGRVVEVVGKRTEFSSPTVFSVVKQAGEWAGVATPFLPNGTLGWVRLDPDRLKAGWTQLALQIDLSQRRAALHEGEEIVRTFPVTVGAPGYDTPTGRFAVTDTFRGDLDPSSYGCCALALTATQPTVPSGWLGGNRIAIHGTTGPLGVAASHGCVRAGNDDVDALIDRVPLGTPVFIRA